MRIGEVLTMDEYIRREDVIAWFMPYAHVGESIDADVVISDIKGMKAADVAPVTRCKDCKYLVNATVNANGFLICDVSDMEIAPDDFCSYGAPKEGTHA